MEKFYKFEIEKHANSKEVICPNCQSKDTYYIIENRWYRCKDCKVDIKVIKNGKTKAS